MENTISFSIKGFLNSDIFINLEVIKTPHTILQVEVIWVARYTMYINPNRRNQNDDMYMYEWYKFLELILINKR